MLQRPEDMNILGKIGFVMQSATNPDFISNYNKGLMLQEEQQMKMQEIERERAKSQALKELAGRPDFATQSPLLQLQQMASITGDATPLIDYTIQQNDPLRAAQIESARAQAQAARANAAQSAAAIQSARAELANRQNTQSIIQNLMQGGGASLGPGAGQNPEVALTALSAMQDPSKLGDFAKAAGSQAEMQKGKQQFESILGELSKQYDQLREEGGTVETGGGIMNIGNYLASTAIGQPFGKALGTKEQSIRDQIQSKVPLLSQALMKATGMTAQQLNSNVELQNFLKAVSSPTTAYGANQSNLGYLSQLYGTGDLAEKVSKADTAGQQTGTWRVKVKQ